MMPTIHCCFLDLQEDYNNFKERKMSTCTETKNKNGEGLTLWFSRENLKNSSSQLSTILTKLFNPLTGLSLKVTRTYITISKQIRSYCKQITPVRSILFIPYNVMSVTYWTNLILHWVHPVVPNCNVSFKHLTNIFEGK